jgi:hypothetical protein
MSAGSITAIDRYSSGTFTQEANSEQLSPICSPGLP